MLEEAGGGHLVDDLDGELIGRAIDGIATLAERARRAHQTG
jgi:hypothetical protein